MKKALITGITGQDGSYLAELLLEKKYKVHGIIRRASTFNTERIDHIFDKVHLHHGDVTTGEGIEALIRKERFDEIYHLAAQSHVRVSFEQPIYTLETTVMGTARLLESLRAVGFKGRLYNACSSEVFGNAKPPQNEKTPMMPRSPYAVGKLAALHLCCMYREAYGLWISSGILFNHESPRRGRTFVSRKITHAVARIRAGKQKILLLGNLGAKRDWGDARQYVRLMWQMLQAEKPLDLVIGSGESWTVRAFVQAAFRYVGLDWRRYVRYDPRQRRPLEVDHLQANAALAHCYFSWNPVGVQTIIQEMIDHDLYLKGD